MLRFWHLAFVFGLDTIPEAVQGERLTYAAR